jgi:DNA-directed RNA polymerase subunit RPC12/RpoP
MVSQEYVCYQCGHSFDVDDIKTVDWTLRWGKCPVCGGFAGMKEDIDE